MKSWDRVAVEVDEDYRVKLVGYTSDGDDETRCDLDLPISACLLHSWLDKTTDEFEPMDCECPFCLGEVE